jgi:hypothetical protein
MDSTLLLLGGGIAFLWFFTKSAVVSNLVFVENGMVIDASNPLRIIINLSVLVQNPTSGSVTLQSLAGYFTINGQQAGNVSNFISSVILPNAETPINLQLSVNDISLVSILMNYVNSESTQLTVGILATANVNNVPMPVNLTFTPIN